MSTNYYNYVGPHVIGTLCYIYILRTYFLFLRFVLWLVARVDGNWSLCCGFHIGWQRVASNFLGNDG